MQIHLKFIAIIEIAQELVVRTHRSMSYKNVSIVQSPSTRHQKYVRSMHACAMECVIDSCCGCATYGHNLCILELACFPKTTNEENNKLSESETKNKVK